MVQKRQLTEEDYDVSPKHLKLENSCTLVSCLEFPLKDANLKPCNSVTDARFSKETSGSFHNFESGKITDHPVCTVNPIPTRGHDPFNPRTLTQPTNTYSCLLRVPPLKEIPIGPDHQADIPNWVGFNPGKNENKFIGSRIIPMPEPESNPTISDGFKKVISECCCEDPGSVRCVRRHIVESRNDLKRSTGNERFSALGFDSMGDDVIASKWTEEDEHLFHEIVYSNPVSLGKNFWDRLEKSFSSKTNREIVSYYFNVFVLQKRAGQNRCDPNNPDSDDDEWRENDPFEENEDSPLDEVLNYGFGIKDSIFDYKDCDFQDDSCTSFEEFQESQTSYVKVDCSKRLTNYEFMFDPSDYFSFPKNKTDFLPTGSMIEEVFGVESWNIEVVDKNDGSGLT